MTTLSDQELAQVETVLRQRLAELANHAPVAVRSPDEIAVVTANRPTGRARRAGVIAAVTALIGAGGFTTYSFLGASNNGGAATPAEAVTDFVSAAEHEDVLGMIDMTLPEEVATLRAAIDSIVADAKRIDVLDTGFDSSGVKGIDISVNDLVLDTNFYEGGLASVRATGGTFGLAFDPQVFPFGQKLRSALPDAQSSTSSVQLGGSDQIAQLMTVQRDGRWYVSIEYTIAEYVRLAAKWDVPGPVTRAPIGFDSPESAVTGFYERLAALDLQSTFDTIAPGEDAMAWLAQSWMTEAQSAIDSGRTKGWSVHVSGLTYETIGTGDHLTLEPVTFKVEGTAPADLNADSGVFPAPSTDGPQPFTIERADGCTTYTGTFAQSLASPWSPVLGVSSDPSAAVSSKVCGRSGGFGVLGLLLLAGSSSDLPSVSVVQSGGRWYVSPLGTMLASMSSGLHHLEAGSSLIDSPLAAFIYGAPNRAFLEAITKGQDAGSIAPECLPALTVDNGKVTASVVDPPPDAVRACLGGSFSSSSSSSGSGVVEAAPLPVPVQLTPTTSP